MSIEQAKQAVRDRVWRLLLDADAVPGDSYGTIPDFCGTATTAEHLAELDVWRRASTVKANPDYAQRHVRARALKDGKLLYMAVPRMADVHPFYLLDPVALDTSIDEAAQKEGAARVASHVAVEDMRPIDLVVCGSVAVNHSGARIGKGAGYSDLEVALLIEAGLITDETAIVTPVHQLQVIDEEIPETAHDFRVDFIVTPVEVIRCPTLRRPAGILWGDLSEDQINSIPALSKRCHP
ncbi:5-formyltetrahydrofolate cyclo-ligase [Sphaerisporangium melleum]|uniref:5-formyltetrahydrofolate cyclo-ligase n=1 Tax=Sphaerisporangium melleum TaxID=321316 RepID=A0A917R0D7_9ACTN|nr:5-formyltetrahydrofolate cyclo-ligase [Sphaerisporangium melleum]GGK81962.1 5-formyltetrahydrofolate cyclo-ligase [Sphaerisporangium melleum]GII73779.1 5-formyltetrahydrofolate cyclo-ligase [Sphaerisporangium melleum]